MNKNIEEKIYFVVKYNFRLGDDPYSGVTKYIMNIKISKTVISLSNVYYDWEI